MHINFISASGLNYLWTVNTNFQILLDLSNLIAYFCIILYFIDVLYSSAKICENAIGILFLSSSI